MINIRLGSERTNIRFLIVSFLFLNEFNHSPPVANSSACPCVWKIPLLARASAHRSARPCVRKIPMLVRASEKFLCLSVRLRIPLVVRASEIYSARPCVCKFLCSSEGLQIPLLVRASENSPACPCVWKFLCLFVRLLASFVRPSQLQFSCPSFVND